MKKRVVSFLLSVMFLTGFFIFPVSANDQLPATSPVISPESSPKTFGLTVLGSGELQVKAGKVFSAGQNEDFALPYVISYPTSVRYPAWALRQGWEGTAVVALEVLENGTVGRTMIMKSTGKSILDKAALQAITSWIFQPAIKDSKPIVSCIQIPVSFELK